MAAIEERDGGALLRRQDVAAEPDPARADAGLRRHVPGAAVTRPDVLLVSLGGTAGLREADEELAASLRASGRVGRRGRRRAAARVADVRAHRARLGALRARPPRRAAIDEHRPRAVVYSSTTAALLAPRPGAIRFDAPAAGNRPGRHGIWQRPVERRRMRDAPLLVPWSEGGAGGGARAARGRGRRARPGRALRALRRSATSPRSPTAPIPAKKGLDRVLAAWAARPARGRGARRSAGAARAAARAGPRDGVRFAGMLPRDDTGRCCAGRGSSSAPRGGRTTGSRSSRRSPTAACSSRALAGPVRGAAARARARLAARRRDRARAIRTALDDPRAGYAERASELLAPWRREAVDAVVREQLLPRLARGHDPALRPVRPHHRRRARDRRRDRAPARRAGRARLARRPRRPRGRRRRLPRLDHVPGRRHRPRRARRRRERHRRGASAGSTPCSPTPGSRALGFVRGDGPGDVRAIIEVNLLGVWRTIRACLPHVIERRGYVLPVASMAAILPPVGLAAYGAAKSGVENLGARAARGDAALRRRRGRRLLLAGSTPRWSAAPTAPSSAPACARCSPARWPSTTRERGSRGGRARDRAPQRIVAVPALADRPDVAQADPPAADRARAAQGHRPLRRRWPSARPASAGTSRSAPAARPSGPRAACLALRPLPERRELRPRARVRRPAPASATRAARSRSRTASARSCAPSARRS